MNIEFTRAKGGLSSQVYSSYFTDKEMNPNENDLVKVTLTISLGLLILHTLQAPYVIQFKESECESEDTQSSPTLGTPWTVAYQASLSMRFSRQGYWSGLPFKTKNKTTKFAHFSK